MYFSFYKNMQNVKKAFLFIANNKLHYLTIKTLLNKRHKNICLLFKPIISPPPAKSSNFLKMLKKF